MGGLRRLWRLSGLLKDHNLVLVYILYMSIIYLDRCLFDELEHERGDILQKGGRFFLGVLAVVVAERELGAAAEAVEADGPAFCQVVHDTTANNRLTRMACTGSRRTGRC